MAILITYATGIAILGIITLYQYYLNTLFIGSYKDKLYYFNAHLITLTTTIMYIYMILTEIFIGEITTLQYFFIEWAFATPLILINLGRLTNLDVNKYIFIIAFDEVMILLGYISYITTNQILSYIMYGLGFICYCCLMTLYLKRIDVLKNDNVLPNSSNIINRRLQTRIYSGILYSIMFSWILYPITYILLKTNTIQIETAIYIFVTLDVLTKGIFTSLLLGFREIYQPRRSLLYRLIYGLFRVEPLEVDINQNSLEEIIETVKVAKKYNLQIVKADTIDANSASKSSYLDYIKAVQVRSLDKILDKTNTNDNKIKVSSDQVLNTIVEDQQDISP